MRFRATVKSDPARRMKGTYLCKIVPEGIQLQKRFQKFLFPHRTPAKYTQGNVIEVFLPTGMVTLAINGFYTYQERLAEAVVEFLRGERDALDAPEFRIEWFFIAASFLPFGIMILTRGGALGGIVAAMVVLGCIALSQVEGYSRVTRLILILLINAAFYAVVYYLVAGARATSA